jgi:hypothetical protein
MDESKKHVFASMSECARNRFLREAHWLLLGLAGLCGIVAFAPFFLPNPGEDAGWFAAGHFALGTVYLCAAIIPACWARAAGLSVWGAYLVYAGIVGQHLFATALVSLVIGVVYLYRTIRLRAVEIPGRPSPA